MTGMGFKKLGMDVKTINFAGSRMGDDDYAKFSTAKWTE